MRILFLFLLCSTFCFGQKIEDYAKVTAYRLINEYDDGPCSIIDYLRESGLGFYVQAQKFTDPKLATSLLNIKKKAKNWKSYKSWCTSRCIGCPIVDKMFIVEMNNYKDTIFTSQNDTYIFYQKDKTAYYDEKGELISIFPKDVQAFLEKDFKPEIESGYLEIDSILPQTIIYKNSMLYGITRKGFENRFEKFDIVNTIIDSLGNNIEIQKKYYLNGLVLNFDHLNRICSISVTNPKFAGGGIGDENKVTVDGISVSDPEIKIMERFPASVRHKKFNRVLQSLEEMKDGYYYEVKLANKAGYVNFHILNGRIKELEVMLLYPQLKP